MNEYDRVVMLKVKYNYKGVEHIETVDCDAYDWLAEHVNNIEILEIQIRG